MLYEVITFIGPFHINIQLPHAADGLGCKGFVKFNHVNVGQCHARLFKDPFHRRHRSQTHIRRIKAAGRKAFNSYNFV